MSSSKIVKVRLSDIDLTDTRFMSRLDIDLTGIANLAEDLRKFGQRNPVGLRLVGGKHQIIYGWHRVKAALLLGWETIEARIYEDITDLQAQLHNISDNVTHENLTTLEIAYQVRKLREVHGLSVLQISELYGGKVQYIYDLLTLTGMKEEIKQAVHLGRISLTHAIEINRFPVSSQLEILDETINDGLSTSKLKRKRGIGIQSKAAGEASSRLSEEELEELAIQSEYRRLERFLLGQVDADSVAQGGLKEEVQGWITTLEAVRSAYGWSPTNVTERNNTLMFSIIRARACPELESYAWKTPGERLMNYELLELTGLRRDKPSREMLGWLIREGRRFNALFCDHHWLGDGAGSTARSVESKGMPG
ncbi:MAG: ParB N-terminal domain-containing protein [Candidatus Bathyarchaeota archaeon]|nr:MAG: ParB N-terminal domain-containing protein [Candidatus Bathyarchaeota archaeon]